MTRKYYLAGLALIVISFAAAAVLYPHLPDHVPTHWNISGQVDDYSAKWTVLVIFPGLMLGTMGLMAALPWLSPRHFEVEAFRSTYLYIMVVVVAFMAYVQALTLRAAWSGQMNMNKAIMGGVCLLIALLGNVLGKVRRNFYIGIRTPWTIADERVWNATHRLGARTFVVGGLVGFLFAMAWNWPWLSLGSVLSGALVPAIYSLVYYKRLEHRGELT
ncbi:MAG: SdpI family protein [Terriglobia bacterium]